MGIGMGGRERGREGGREEREGGRGEREGGREGALRLPGRGGHVYTCLRTQIHLHNAGLYTQCAFMLNCAQVIIEFSR